MANKKIWIILVVIVIIIMMVTKEEVKKEGMSPYRCYMNVGGKSTSWFEAIFNNNPPATVGPFGTIWVVDSLGAEIHRKTDFCIGSELLQYYWCDTFCSQQNCWAPDSETFVEVTYLCPDGCSGGQCVGRIACRDECILGDKRCLDSNTAQTCGELASGCNEWGSNLNCPLGCSGDRCVPPITYSNFLSYKNSYLAGGSFSTFISDANQWVI